MSDVRKPDRMNSLDDKVYYFKKMEILGYFYQISNKNIP